MKYASMDIFQEAIDHCRWKKVLLKELLKIRLEDYKNKTFEEIYTEIKRFITVRGIGPLTKYDITSAICRYYNIVIQKVYIIGKGPIRAINLLHLKTKLDKTVRLKYVDVDDVLNAFNGKILSRDGDLLETYLCNWQKGVK